MKKFFSFATLVALVLGCLVFTSCSEPAPYEGKYYNTEFARITDAEYQTYWNGTTTEVRFAHRATWSEKSSHEKKTTLKDYELKAYLKSKMVITDEEILSAISYHTTGRPGMTDLEKVVFLADYLEPFRTQPTEPDLNKIRRIAFEDIDKAVYLALKNTLRYLESRGQETDMTTAETFEEYRIKYENK